MLASLLVAAAVIIVLHGLTKLGGSSHATHGIPWGSLLIWATLFGTGVSTWLAFRGH